VLFVIYVDDNSSLSCCWKSRNNTWKSFAFDRVWKADALQADIFADVEPLVLSVTEGFNACIMAYGQTGSGKTHTMNGHHGQYGVNYRTIQKVFDILELKKARAINNRRKSPANSRPSSLRSRQSSFSSIQKRPASVELNIKDIDNLVLEDVQERSESQDTISMAHGVNYTVQLSMMEIYNEQVLLFPWILAVFILVTSRLIDGRIFLMDFLSLGV
jgi:hypothetical protein